VPGDGNGKIGRHVAYLSDRCLCDGVGGGNDNSRLLAAAAVPIVGQERPRRQRGPEGRGGGPKTRLAELRSHPAQIRFANRAFEGGLNDHLHHLAYMHRWFDRGELLDFWI
jgi:hypothetical protein